MSGKILPTKAQDAAICPRGFTLIELLVVIAIIALLLAIVAPALRKAKDQAKLVVCGNNMHQLVRGINSYAADYETKLPYSVQQRHSTIWTIPFRLNYNAGQDVHFERES